MKATSSKGSGRSSTESSSVAKFYCASNRRDGRFGARRFGILSREGHRVAPSARKTLKLAGWRDAEDFKSNDPDSHHEDDVLAVKLESGLFYHEEHEEHEGRKGSRLVFLRVESQARDSAVLGLASPKSPLDSRTQRLIIVGPC